MKQVAEQIAGANGWGYLYKTINDANLELDELDSCRFPLLVHLQVESGQLVIDDLNRVKDKTLDMIMFLSEYKKDDDIVSIVDQTKQMAKTFVRELNNADYLEWLNTVDYTIVSEQVYDRNVGGIMITINEQERIGSCK